VALDPAAISDGAVPAIDNPVPEITADVISAVAVPVFVSVTDWLVLVPSAILPKLTLVGFAESVAVPVPEPPPDPEPPLEPEPDAPLLTTPAQLDSPIETTIRTSVANRATTAPSAGFLAFIGSDGDNSKCRTSLRLLIIRTVYEPISACIYWSREQTKDR
jgi:hypothetical protein